VAPNIEFYEFDPPPNPSRAPWPRPHPDIPNYSLRDYGNRAGWQRMMRAMDEVGVRGSVSLNVAMCEHHPEIIKAAADRGWAFFSHGIYNTRYVYGLDKEQERAIVIDSRKTILEHTGQRLDGWLSPALSNNPWSLDVLAEEGVLYTCDLFHDDQPTPVNVSTGRLISIPYSLEMNDTIAYNVNHFTPRHYGEIIKRQFDQLYREGGESGTVMCIPLHPYLVGQPHRIDAFAEALSYITGHDHVWLATGREIAMHYLEHHYDTVAQAIAAINNRMEARCQ
jgi:peptidoglycan/xylan/chitin deacetylase (PgdA/CDA1 family)